jgi:hypothetical protein
LRDTAFERVLHRALWVGSSKPEETLATDSVEGRRGSLSRAGQGAQA